MNKWLSGFESSEAAVMESVDALKNHPLMPKDVRIHGFIMDPTTGKLEVLV